MITLLTDFGYTDPYVGAMKGVILTINPNVRIIDITHDISPQNTDEAAFILRRVYPYFPEGSIHVVVVDPGVGSDRAILAVRTDQYIFLAPDNSVLKYIFDEHSNVSVYRITNSDYFLSKVSQTFHGRDIFAPVAAHLSKGTSLNRLGEITINYIQGNVTKPVLKSKQIKGEIIYIDKFGNGVTNIKDTLLKNRLKCIVLLKNKSIHGLSKTYADVPVGELLALIGSDNTLEISVRGANASGDLGFTVGDSVTVSFE